MAEPMIQLHMLKVGECRQCAKLANRSAPLGGMHFPALCALILHPTQGAILFDTGYSDHFFHACQHFPEKLYAIATPVSLPPSETLQHQLSTFGLQAKDIRTIILSHFHADHIAGIKDFPNARFFSHQQAWKAFQQLTASRLRGVKHGYLKGLLPTDFHARWQTIDTQPSCALPTALQPFTQGFDLFGDGSLIAVSLAGHAHGQIGLYLPGLQTFLIADACWSLPALLANQLPPNLVMQCFMQANTYRQTFQSLRQIAHREPTIRLIPSHCTEAWLAWQAS